MKTRRRNSWKDCVYNPKEFRNSPVKHESLKSPKPTKSSHLILIKGIRKSDMTGILLLIIFAVLLFNFLPVTFE